LITNSLHKKILKIDAAPEPALRVSSLPRARGLRGALSLKNRGHKHFKNELLHTFLLFIAKIESYSAETAIVHKVMQSHAYGQAITYNAWEPKTDFA